MPLAAVAAAVLLAVVALFQGALAIGAPWGAAAWGGQHPGVLPKRLRVTSAAAALLVYPLLIVVVLDSAVVVDVGIPGTGATAMWLLAGLFGLGTAMNAVSRSRAERLWAPVVLVIALCCALVAATI